MSAIALHWYDANEERPYPLSDAATSIDSNGQMLPYTILADLKLQYPSTLGLYPFLASVCVTSSLVSITIQAAASPTDNASFVPVAVFSMAQPVTPYVHYPLQGQADGVGGWVVFGEGVGENYTGRLPGPEAGLLSPRAARAYRPLPVSSLAFMNMTPMTGMVNLQVDAPLQVSKESHEIDGVVRDVIVFRLAQPGGDPNVLSTTNQANVFREFAGICGARPESGTCGDPQPVEFLNTIAPDCNGNIDVVFNGCAIMGAVTDGSGVVLDCGLSLAVACQKNTLPDETGKLPNDYPNQCSQNSESVSESMPPTHSDSVQHSHSNSESIPMTGSLPYVEGFGESDSVAPHWITASGRWKFVDDDAPDDPTISPYHRSYSTETLIGPTQRNIALWEGFDHQPLSRRYTTEFKLVSGLVNTGHNAGIVLNYRPHPLYPGRSVYMLIQLDYDAQQLNVLQFNGTGFIPEPVFADIANLNLDIWYKLVVDVTPGTGANVNIAIQLNSLSGMSVAVSLTLSTSQYLPAAGYCGIHCNRGYARFGYFEVEEL